ncbi:MAG TPA: ATP-dependent DNA helicase RecG [Candidatus Binatia bacterium]|nr:ATP-dependent DNA helicase RecG [Candidatus Binatia bacterium]
MPGTADAKPPQMARILKLPSACWPETPIGELKGVQPAKAQLMAKLGITTVSDLLYHLPRRYEDSRDLVPLRALVPGKVQVARVRVRDARGYRSPRRHMALVEATLEDADTSVSAIWFNQPYLASELTSGLELLVHGKVIRTLHGLQFQSPRFERVSSSPRHVGRLAAVYPETAKLTSTYLRGLISRFIPVADRMPDRLPPEVRDAEGLMPVGDALRQVHLPDDEREAAEAQERLAFEELFLLQLAAERARRRRLSSAGVVVPYEVQLARAFVASLPFRLTDGQRVAAHEILTDMAGSGPMNRLLQGDVGSGKTVVAAMAALMAHHAGYQSVVMAPTEILAHQHHETLLALLSPHGLSPRLLLGSTTVRARREILEGLAGGHDSLVVGTHALIEEDVILNDLGLVVVDEQQRFGVTQRQRLRLKARAIPNFLAMTATPIPRSLALTLYGDVNVSELREMPPGRLPVETRVVPPYQRAEAYDFVRDQVRSGRQVFVICPLIEESDKLGVKSVTAEHRKLEQEVFPDLRLELLHGRMTSREKEERMARFAAGEADLLVATTVVEVGVDVPNATVMIVEAAERFGLAQLHQLRGRVGRSHHRAYCLLFEGGIDEEGSRRLQAVARSQSGFELAELDLKLRGPGDVAGLRQHGLPEMRAADLLDIALAQRARAAATRWLDRDPELTAYEPLREAMHGYSAVFDLD